MPTARYSEEDTEGQKFKVILAYEASLWPAQGTRDFGSEKKIF